MMFMNVSSSPWLEQSLQLSSQCKHTAPLRRAGQCRSYCQTQVIQPITRAPGGELLILLICWAAMFTACKTAQVLPTQSELLLVRLNDVCLFLFRYCVCCCYRHFIHHGYHRLDHCRQKVNGKHDLMFRSTTPYMQTLKGTGNSRELVEVPLWAAKPWKLSFSISWRPFVPGIPLRSILFGLK